MSTEKKKGLMWKPPIEFPVGDVTIRALGFIPLPASLCILPAVNRESKKLDMTKLTAEMIWYFLKQCVIDPAMDDEYLRNSESTALIQVFNGIMERIQPSTEQLTEIKKTMPTRP